MTPLFSRRVRRVMRSSASAAANGNGGGSSGSNSSSRMKRVSPLAAVAVSPPARGASEEELGRTSGGVGTDALVSVSPPMSVRYERSSDGGGGGRGRGGIGVRTGAMPQYARLLEPEVASSTPLAYEVVAGDLVKWSENSSASPSIPCCVLLHGMLGNRRNLAQLARRLAEAFPAWMCVLVDLRCHGDSSTESRTLRQSGEHDLPQTARDVLQTLSILGLYPRIVIGHSFGGKTALSMAKQLGARALPSPTHMWILDTVPGPARPNFGMGQGDQPQRLINYILASAKTKPVHTRQELVYNLIASGFSEDVAMWMTTNVRENARGELEWTYTLDGLSPMYSSYEREDLWDVVENPPLGLKLDFVEAERSSWHWHDFRERIRSHGGNHHILAKSGHWVHRDNPSGLLELMSHSFYELHKEEDE